MIGTNLGYIELARSSDDGEQRRSFHQRLLTSQPNLDRLLHHRSNAAVHRLKVNETLYVQRAMMQRSYETDEHHRSRAGNLGSVESIPDVLEYSCPYSYST